MNKGQLTKTALAIKLALVLSVSFSASATQVEVLKDEKKVAEQKAKAAKSKKAKEEDELEVITVTGIRGSLRENLNNKRFSNSIVDSLNSEDVTKNPDKNVAEALQRISGVQLVSEFGEGVGISIRGTSPDLTNTLVNGQALASAQWLPNKAEENATDFSGVAAEQIAKIEVYKSPQADLPSGGIGGTVILHTRSPLQQDSGRGYVNVETQYNDGSETFSPQIAGQYSWHNEEGNFGALVNLSYGELNVQRDGFEVWSYYDFYTVSSSSQYAGDRPLKPSWVNSTRFTQNREKTNANIALEYQPSDSLNLKFDYLGSFADMGNKSQAMLFRPYEAWQVVLGDDNAWSPLTREVTLEDGTTAIEAYLVNDMTLNVLDFRNRSFVRSGNPDIWQQTIDRDGTTVDTETFSLKANYEIANWVINGEIGRSSSESHKADFMNSVYLNKENSDEVNNLLDNYTATYTYGNGKPSYYIDNDMLINPTKEFAQNEFWDKYVDINNTSDYVKFDAQVELENEFNITSVKFGAIYTDSTRDRIRMQSDSNIYGARRGGHQGYTVDTFVNGTVSGLHDKGGFSANEFFSMDSALAKEMFFDLPVVENRDTCDDLGVEYCRSAYKQWGTSYELRKDNLEAFLMVNFAGDNFRGNIGGRFISRDIERDIVRSNGELPPQQTGGYDNFTPSFNLAVDLKEDLVMRLAASKTISQPSFYKTIGDISGINLGAINVARGGNPDLKAFESDQAEIGAEWYFTESSLFSATVFYKEISNWIVDTTVLKELEYLDLDGNVASDMFYVTTPTNAEGTQYMSGLETQLQHDFGNGLGFTFNYTYSEVPSIKVNALDLISDENGNIEGDDGNYSYEMTEKEIVMKGNSRHTANASVYYEDDIYSARLSYNYRSEYVVSENLVQGMTSMKHEKGTVDLKATYKIYDSFVLTASVMNLTNELDELFFRMTEENAKRPEYVGDYFGRTYETGRRLFVGLNYRF